MKMLAPTDQNCSANIATATQCINQDLDYYFKIRIQNCIPIFDGQTNTYNRPEIYKRNGVGISISIR